MFWAAANAKHALTAKFIKISFFLSAQSDLKTHQQTQRLKSATHQRCLQIQIQFNNT